MFAANSFGSMFFAGFFGSGRVPVPPPVPSAVTGGGSGFPQDWLSRMQNVGPGAGDRELAEMEEMLALGML